MPGLMLLLAMMPNVAAQDDLSRPPLVIGSPASWTTADDYPLDALRRNEQGTVEVRFRIAPDGQVGSCEIAHSSGSPLLDSTTCTLIQAKARYEPARDREGRPVESAPLTMRIAWVLPDAATEIARPFRREILLDVAGKVVGCRVNVLAGTAFPKDPCDPASRPDSLAPYRNARGTALPGRATFTTSLTYAPRPAP